MKVHIDLRERKHSLNIVDADLSKLLHTFNSTKTIEEVHIYAIFEQDVHPILSEDDRVTVHEVQKGTDIHLEEPSRGEVDD